MSDLQAAAVIGNEGGVAICRKADAQGRARVVVGGGEGRVGRLALGKAFRIHSHLIITMPLRLCLSISNNQSMQGKPPPLRQGCYRNSVEVCWTGRVE